MELCPGNEAYVSSGLQNFKLFCLGLAATLCYGLRPQATWAEMDIVGEGALIARVPTHW
jgi:hypothetical protein